MSALDIQPDGSGRFLLRGELSFNTVSGAWQAGQELFQGHAKVALDLGGVTRADSAGLALLVAWRREGQQQGWSLTLEKVPEQLLAIARISGLLDVLGLAG